jgi:hypothetical protein
MFIIIMALRICDRTEAAEDSDVALELDDAVVEYQ